MFLIKLFWHGSDGFWWSLSLSKSPGFRCSAFSDIGNTTAGSGFTEASVALATCFLSFLFKPLAMFCYVFNLQPSTRVIVLTISLYLQAIFMPPSLERYAAAHGNTCCFTCIKTLFSWFTSDVQNKRRRLAHQISSSRVSYPRLFLLVTPRAESQETLPLDLRMDSPAPGGMISLIRGSQKSWQNTHPYRLQMCFINATPKKRGTAHAEISRFFLNEEMSVSCFSFFGCRFFHVLGTREDH